jgi:metallo-beta-lactamase class B
MPRIVLAMIVVLSLFSLSHAAPPADCPRCGEWAAKQAPFKVYGNTYYVGTRGISSILVTSDEGHVLIDAGVAEAAPQVAANIRALGFRIKDVRLILNSHVHFDHAGGLAALQHLSGAQVAASASSAKVLESGRSGRDDPQFGSLGRGTEPIHHIRVIADGEQVKVGTLVLTAHFTPGHTPGGTSWSWKSCEHDRCLNIVYADSLSAIAADGFKFSDGNAHPHALSDFEKSFQVLKSLPCDILLTPHPEGSDMFERLERRNFVDPNACREYADEARANLERRVAHEKG